MVKTEIFTSLVGGSTTPAQAIQIAATQPGEQLEIKLTKRTNGVVRVTTQEGATSTSVSGIELPLDTTVEFRLAEGQRAYLISPETINVQSVDIIKQPVATPQALVKPLEGMAGAMNVPGFFGDTGNNYYCPPKNYKK